MMCRSTSVAAAPPRAARARGALLGLLLIAAAAIPARAEAGPLDSRSAQSERGRRRARSLRRIRRCSSPSSAPSSRRSGVTRTGARRARARGTAGRRGNAAEAGRDAEGSFGLVGRAGDRRAQRRGPARTWRACRARCKRLCRRRPEAPRPPRGRSRTRLDDAACRGWSNEWARRRSPNGRSATSGCCASCRRCVPIALAEIADAPRGRSCSAVRRPCPASLRQAPGAERSVLRHPVGADRSRRRHQRAAGVGPAAADNAG